jgi:acyl-homoserine-lactone acylase
MLLGTVCAVLLGVSLQELRAQPTINPRNIQIIRDKWGVPHIYGKTDAETAYGLAWAHAEDNFHDMQLNMLNGLGRLGEVQGKDGAVADFLIYFMGIDTMVDNRYETAFSPEFKRVLEGYCAGLNRYAEKHPDQVLIKGTFPIHPKTVIKGYCFMPSASAGLGMCLRQLRNGTLTETVMVNEGGSNAAALSPKRTTDGSGYLLVNSHQPTEGRFAWYEAHIKSDEGTNILGGLFPGGLSIFVGTNEHLGWAHTNNYFNFGDVYKLVINPKNPNQYRFGDQWLNFTERTVKLKVKVGPVKIPVRRTIRGTVHGPVMQGTKDKEWYAFRFPGYMDCKEAEQWWRMQKARNLEEFKQVVKMNALPLFNIIYADKAGNIFYVSDGQFPKRDPNLNWLLPVPGDKPEYLWTELQPWEAKPKVENPACGYIYNANNTPLHATCEAENWTQTFPGMQLFEYNRGDRFGELFRELDGRQISFQDLVRIKRDVCYSQDKTYRAAFGTLYELNPDDYPEIADAIRVLKKWNLCGEVNNRQAALALVTHHRLKKNTDYDVALRMIIGRKVTEEEATQAILEAKEWLLDHYGTLEPELGEVQRHTKGGISLPIDGLYEVPAARHATPPKDDDSYFRNHGGDCYYMYIKYDPKARLPEIQSVNAYGASNRENSPHYTDQMEMFVRYETKSMTLDWEEVKKNARKTYSPK